MLRSLLVTLLAVAACGDDPAVVPADATPDASEDAPSGCNDLVLSGGPIAGNNLAIDAPTPQGGTIVPGTYVLVAVTTYVGAGGTSGPTGRTHRGMITSDATTYTSLEETTAATTTTLRQAGSYTITGVAVNATETCPSTNAFTLNFDATPTQFILYGTVAPTLARTYAKQ